MNKRVSYSNYNLLFAAFIKSERIIYQMCTYFQHRKKNLKVYSFLIKNFEEISQMSLSDCEGVLIS